MQKNTDINNSKHQLQTLFVPSVCLICLCIYAIFQASAKERHIVYIHGKMMQNDYSLFVLYRIYAIF